MMRQREDYTHPCRERTHRARPLASAFAVPAASFLRGCRRQKESKGAFSFCHHQQRMFFYFIFSLCAWGRAGPSFLTAEREQDHIFSPPAEGQLFVFYTYLFLFALRPRGPILSGGRKDAKTAEGEPFRWVPLRNPLLTDQRQHFRPPPVAGEGRKWRAPRSASRSARQRTSGSRAPQEKAPLWSVRRGFRRGTHRKGSPWWSLLPFWHQKGRACAA